LVLMMLFRGAVWGVSSGDLFATGFNGGIYRYSVK
jgi:hypothetical protein